MDQMYPVVIPLVLEQIPFIAAYIELVKKARVVSTEQAVKEVVSDD